LFEHYGEMPRLMAAEAAPAEDVAAGRKALLLVVFET
jgi:hypothetical protein